MLGVYAHVNGFLSSRWICGPDTYEPQSPRVQIWVNLAGPVIQKTLSHNLQIHLVPYATCAVVTVVHVVAIGKSPLNGAFGLVGALLSKNSFSFLV